MSPIGFELIEDDDPTENVESGEDCKSHRRYHGMTPREIAEMLQALQQKLSRLS